MVAELAPGALALVAGVLVRCAPAGSNTSSGGMAAAAPSAADGDAGLGCACVCKGKTAGQVHVAGLQYIGLTPPVKTVAATPHTLCAPAPRPGPVSCDL